MRILLAYKADRHGAVDPHTSLLPTGLGYLNALLRREGFASRLANLSRASWREIEALLERERPALLGISQFTHNRFESLKLAALAKRHNPDCVTILGGPHATHRATALLSRYPAIDAIVLGEGEETVLELAQRLAAGDCRLSAVAGLACRDGDEIRHSVRPPVSDLDGLPFPAAFMDDAWQTDAQRQLEFIITSRGCPAACRFCSSPRFWGRTIRFRSPRSIVDEIRYIRDRYGLIYFSLRDDTFTTRKERVIEFCRLLLEERLYVLWNCQSRVSCVDEEMLGWMRRAGCECVQYGVESGSEAVLVRLGKGITPEQVRRAARATRRAGIELSIYLITGVPGEGEADLQATLQLIREIRPHDGQVAPLAFYPGTALFADAVARGEVPEDLFEQQRGAAFYVRDDPFVGRATEELLQTVARTGRRARFAGADFAAQKRLLGFCHATNLAAGLWRAERGDPAGAAAEYREIIARQPENPWGPLALGELLGMTGDLIGAEAEFQRVLALVPRHVPAYLALGDLRLMAGDGAGARTFFEQARRLSPGDGEVRERLRSVGRE